MASGLGYAFVPSIALPRLLISPSFSTQPHRPSPVHPSRRTRTLLAAALEPPGPPKRAEDVSGGRGVDHETPEPGGPVGLFSERARVVVLCFIAFVICNCDRINLSVAILPMARELGWSQSVVGIIQGSFYVGYTLTQLPSGYLSDKYGGRNILSMGVLAWSLMTFVTPLAAVSGSLPVLLVARVLLGIGEGVAMPAMNQIISRWVPRQERSRSLSLIYSGMYLGSTVGLLSCPPLIAAFGWPSVFYFFGGLGGLWYAFWHFFSAATPDASVTISDAERVYIAAGSDFSPDDKVGDVPWKIIFTNKATWAIIIAHFCCTWGYFVLNAWLPTFLNLELGFDLASSAFLSVLPWLAMFLSANVGGQVADNLYKGGMSMTRVRKLMQTIGFVGPAIFLGLVTVTHNPYAVVGLMTMALALGSASQSGVYSNHQDIGPGFAGILLGMSNTGAAIPGIIGVPLTGFILDATGDWSLVFGIAIGFYLLGTVVYNLLASGEKQF